MKERIPDKETLRKKLSSVLSSSLTDFIQSTSSRRAELKGNRRYFILSIFFIFAMVPGLYFTYLTTDGIYRDILVGCTMLWAVVLALSGRKWLTNTKLLAREMNMALVPILTNTFDRMLMYTNNTGHSFITQALLADSRLLTDSDLEYTSDDMYSLFGPAETTIRELVVHKKVAGENRRPDTYTSVFKGVFVVADMPKTLQTCIFPLMVTAKALPIEHFGQICWKVARQKKPY